MISQVPSTYRSEACTTGQFDGTPESYQTSVSASSIKTLMYGDLCFRARATALHIEAVASSSKRWNPCDAIEIAVKSEGSTNVL